MHRSGTSCLAGSLQGKGLYLGEVAVWNEHNRKGNRENETLAELNEAVLNYSGGSWHQPPARIRWRRAHARQRNALVKQFEGTKNAVWGFKDTRVTLTLPFWQEAIPRLEYAGTFRHPLLVAQSLQRRDRMPLEYALQVWCAYNERLLEVYRQKSFPIVSFDLDQAAYLVAIDRIANVMQLPAPGGEAFLDKELKTTAIEVADSLLTARASALYTELQQAYAATLTADPRAI
jgi:hypothetical protein